MIIMMTIITITINYLKNSSDTQDNSKALIKNINKYNGGGVKYPYGNGTRNRKCW